MSYLQQIVFRKIQELGEADAAEFFDVPLSRVQGWVRGESPIPLFAAEKVFSTEEVLHEFGRVEQANWEGKKLALLLPFYKSTTPLTAFSIMSMLDRTKMTVLQSYGDAFIVHTRNKLANAFVDTGIEWSMWIDDDMVLPCGDAAWFNRETGFNFSPKFAGLHLINRLISHRKTLIGGLYFGRNRHGKPMYYEAVASQAEREFAHMAPHDMIKPVTWVATGAMLVHRSVYTDIQANFPTLKPQRSNEGWHYFSNSETDLTKSTADALEILNDASVSEEARIRKVQEILRSGQEASLKNSRLVQGEDVTFCKRAKVSGHQPYVDLAAVCGHIGMNVWGPSGRKRGFELVSG